jgi:hypothetical protein
MSTVLTKALTTTVATVSGATILPRYPNGINGLQNSSGVVTNGATPSNGGTVLASGTQVVALAKKYGPNLADMATIATEVVQQAATILVCDQTAMTSDEGNQVKNSQNYGAGQTGNAVEAPGSGNAGTTATVGLGGATYGIKAGYSIMGQ